MNIDFVSKELPIVGNCEPNIGVSPLTKIWPAQLASSVGIFYLAVVLGEISYCQVWLTSIRRVLQIVSQRRQKRDQDR